MLNLFRKGLAVILALALLSGMLPGMGVLLRPAYAAAPIGDGTPNNPYQITSDADLEWMRTNYNSIKSRYFVQMNDIDLSGVANFVPIGETTSYSGFTGTYDGGWHTISNLNITSAPNNYYAGLFMVIGNGGSVRNLKFTGVNINISPTRSEYIGTVAGQNAGTIENCYLISGSVKGGNNTQAGALQVSVEEE